MSRSLRRQGQPVDSVFPLFNEETRDYVANAIKETARTGVSSYPTHQSVMQRKDGVLIRIEDSASPIFDIHAIDVGGVLVFRDATNERRSHELLRKTEMLAASARIASSVSSEIDAHQEAVGSLIYIVKTNGGVSTASSELLGLAEKELARATHITRQVSVRLSIRMMSAASCAFRIFIRPPPTVGTTFMTVHTGFSSRMLLVATR